MTRMKAKSKRSIPTRADAVSIYEWCVNRYGRSKVNGNYPYLEYRKPDYLSEGTYGEYDWDENVIKIFKDKNKTLLDLIDTLIHEWTHYLQPVRSHCRRMAKEGRLEEAFEENDPLEKKAKRIAKRDRNKCYKEIYKQL